MAAGGAVYGQRVPVTFGGPFTWAGQRYIERSVSQDARKAPHDIPLSSEFAVVPANVAGLGNSRETP